MHGGLSLAVVAEVEPLVKSLEKKLTCGILRNIANISTQLRWNSNVEAATC